MNYMKILFGMSRIKQYQIKKVLGGIYDTYRSKNGARNFLISPESFTYIFKGKTEDECINKLKICLLMIEKDMADKYNFKVLIARPRSVFTTAFICINKEHEKEVLKSEYGRFMQFVAKGRQQQKQLDGSLLSDAGDIYKVDLKTIWETFNPDISFPQFKYWYFNPSGAIKNKISIMESIRPYISPRQKITVEARGEYLLTELRPLILEDFKYIVNQLYGAYRRKYFTIEDFTNTIKEEYGVVKARIIANSLFDLIDPDGKKCVKRRGSDSSGKATYSLSNGNLEAFMKQPITRSSIMNLISLSSDTAIFEGYISLLNDNVSNTALKLLSIFDYITYEITGGQEPEIFVRLNDPNKVRNIVYGNLPYSNSYVSKAKQKHERDVAVLLKFFNGLKSDEERWNYIENYFLGQDVLQGYEPTQQKVVKLSRSIDKDHSYPTNKYRKWADIWQFFDEDEKSVLSKLDELNIPIPEYLETTIKHSDEGKDIIASWPSKNIVICKQDTTDRTIEYFGKKGWFAYRVFEMDGDEIKRIIAGDSIKSVIDIKSGADLRDTDYIEIWDGILQWTDNENEIHLLEVLIDKAEALVNKEKPWKNVSFKEEAEEKTYVCDLLWKKSKIAYFTADNNDGIQILKKSGWTCFSGKDTKLSAKKIISAIKEI